MNKVPFINNYEINFLPFKKVKNYGVEIKNWDNNILKTNMHYEIEVECIDYKNQYFTFEINQKQVYINNIIPDTKIEKLVYQAGKTLYPLQISVNQFGQIESIKNHKNTKLRWISEKENLKNYYTGQKVQKIIDSIDEILLNENTLLRSLYKNWFFTLFFSPLYISYTDSLNRVIQRNYPIFGDKTASFKATHTISNYCSPKNKVLIKAIGKTNDPRTIHEVLNGDSTLKYQLSKTTLMPINCEFEIEYVLNALDRSINLITANFLTRIDQTITKKTSIEICEL